MARPINFDKYYKSLDWDQKRELEKIQMQLAEEGFGEGSDFRMIECWKEAIKRHRQINLKGQKAPD